MKTEIDKTVIKIKKLLKKHTLLQEYLEVDKITDKSCNLYLVGRLGKDNTRYEQKYIETITFQ